MKDKIVFFNIVVISFILALLINSLFFPNLNILTTNISSQPNIEASQIALITLLLFGETSALTALFWLGTKKFFKK